eukprot:327253-Pelagomonas_calceolata.AAC.1
MVGMLDLEKKPGSACPAIYRGMFCPPLGKNERLGEVALPKSIEGLQGSLPCAGVHAARGLLLDHHGTLSGRLLRIPLNLMLIAAFKKLLVMQ